MIIENGPCPFATNSEGLQMYYHLVVFRGSDHTITFKTEKKRIMVHVSGTGRQKQVAELKRGKKKRGLKYHSRDEEPSCSARFKKKVVS